MTLLWFISVVALLVALVAWRQGRRSAKRLAQLTEMHWELKYQQGELRARLQRMGGGAPPSPPEAPGTGLPGESFVPLSSLAPHRAGVRGGDPAKR